jgi:hypothetical protein
MASASIPASFAQGEGGGLSVYGAGSRQMFLSAGMPPHKAGTAGDCPGVSWHINRVPSGNTVTLSGPVWLDNGSGVSFASGSGNPTTGQFSLNVNSVSGSGPSGTISGMRHPDGSIDLTIAGTPCFAGTFHLKPGQTSTRL